MLPDGVEQLYCRELVALGDHHEHVHYFDSYHYHFTETERKSGRR